MQKTPETLTPAECEKFINSISWHRDKLMCLLMLDAGLRVGELVQLERTDLYKYNLPVAAVRIRAEISKSKIERIVPIGSRIVEAIVLISNEYWKRYRLDKSQWAFNGYKIGKHISRRQVERIVNKHSLLSIGREIHPHVLRHTFATRLMRTTNARVVQELLGHKNLQTTQIYTHPNHEDMTKAIQSLET